MNTIVRLMPCLLAAGITACASTTAPAIPTLLDPGPTTKLAMVVAATGVQIYECRAKKDAVGYEWAFVAPDADLLDARGSVVGRHGAGPYWQANDGSRVVGTVRERADAPEANAIPWLLLATRSTGAEGAFSRVTSIQRVSTTGGVAPSTGCSAEAVGKTARIAYTADYRLFTAK